MVGILVLVIIILLVVVIDTTKWKGVILSFYFAKFVDICYTSFNIGGALWGSLNLRSL